VFHLLDDSLTICPSHTDALRAERVKDELLRELAIEEQDEKRCAPTRSLEFLGLILDFAQGTVGLPADKRSRLVAPLRAMAHSGRCRLRELEATVGLATFAGLVVPCHRPLLSSLIAVQAIARRIAQRKGRGKARFTYVSLSAAAREDAADLADAFDAAPHLRWESLFVTPASADQAWSVDAAGREGCGGFSLDTHEWFHATWPAGWSQEEEGMSSALQELVAVAFLVERAPSGSAICVWTDSHAARDAFGRARSSKPRVNALLRAILLACLKRDVTLIVAWHRRASSLSALAADSLSRGLISLASRQVPGLVGARRVPASSTVTQLCERVSRATLTAASRGARVKPTPRQ
jgi:hypothetical protein